MGLFSQFWVSLSDVPRGGHEAVNAWRRGEAIQLQAIMPQLFSAEMAGDPMAIGTLPERRRLALATRKLRDGAPGVKMAAGWWADGAGNFARQSDALPLHFWIWNRDRRQQRFSVGG